MFKNILKFLFEEEDEEIIEEQPLEEISIHQQVEAKKPVEKTIRTRVETPKETPPVVKQKVEEVKQPNEARVLTPSHEDNKPKKRFIDFDEPQTMTRSNHYAAKSEAKRDYEVSPVISPIFGTKEDQAARSSMSQDDPVVRVKKKNPLGTIISPMYGARELEEMEDQAQARLAKQDFDFEESQVLDSDPYKPPVISHITLDEIIDNDDEDMVDDVMQFSLFGGEEAIKKADEAHVYALDEEE